MTDLIFLNCSLLLSYVLHLVFCRIVLLCQLIVSRPVVQMILVFLILIRLALVLLFSRTIRVS